MNRNNLFIYFTNVFYIDNKLDIILCAGKILLLKVVQESCPG